MFDTSAENELESKSGVDVDGIVLVMDVLLLVSLTLFGVVTCLGITDSVTILDSLPKYAVSLKTVYIPKRYIVCRNYIGAFVKLFNMVLSPLLTL